MDGTKQSASDATFGLNAIFGANRPLSTNGQGVTFRVTIPEGYYGDVKRNDNTMYPQNTTYGNYSLGADPAYGRSDYSDEHGDPGYFSRSEVYAAAAGSARSAQTVRVDLTSRDSDYLQSTIGLTGTAVDNVNINTVTQNDDGSYTWTGTFRVSYSNLTAYALDGLYINNEAIDVPYLANDDAGQVPVSATTTLSTNEKVTLELYDMSRNTGGMMRRYYRLTVTGAYRDLVITNAETSQSGNLSNGRLVLNKATGVNVWLWIGSSAKNDNKWEFVAESGDRRLGTNNNSFEFGNSGRNFGGTPGIVWEPDPDYENLRVQLQAGYAWPNAGRDGTGGNPKAWLYTTKPSDDGTTTVVDKTGEVNLEQDRGDDYWYDLLTKNPDSSAKRVFLEIEALPISYKVQYLSGYSNGSWIGPNASLDTSKMGSSVPNAMPTSTATYTQLDDGTNFFAVTNTKPTATGDNPAAFQYWVLTNASGNPVKMDGTPAGPDPSGWVTFAGGDVKQISEFIAFTQAETGAAGYDPATVTFTLYLTAFWKEPIDGFVHYITFNTRANASGRQEKQFAGETYTKETGGTIKAAFRREVEFNLDEFGSSDSVPITVDKAEMLNKLGEYDGYQWYKLDDAKNGDYYWPAVTDDGEVDVWFLYTLGKLAIKNDLTAAEDIEGNPITIKYTVKFTLPSDNPDTCGDESKFFEQYSGAIPSNVTKNDDGSYSFTLEDEGEVTFTLPEGTTYEVTMAETDYSVITDQSTATAETDWAEHNATKDNGVDNGKFSETGYKTGTIVAYDTHNLTFEVEGKLSIALTQTAHPDTDREVTSGSSNFEDVEEDMDPITNFSHLNYNAVVHNLMGTEQTVTVVITVDTTNKGTGEDARILNFVTDDPKDSISVTGGVQGEYDEDAHTITWKDVTIASGQTLTFTVQTSLPAVVGITTYAANATATPAGGTAVPSNEVDVTVYSNWLRIVKFVNSDEDDDFKEEFTFKAYLTAPSGESLATEYPYKKFADSDTFGADNAMEPDDDNGDGKLAVKTDGDGSYVEFKLSHDQRIVIYDLPLNAGYEVKEILDKSQELKYSQIITYGAEGNITANSEMVVFTNTPSQRLTISKAVKGDSDTTKEFEFTITLTLPADIHWESENGKYEFEYGNNESITFTESTEQKSEGGGAVTHTYYTYTATANLSDGDTITLVDLPVGTTYTVTEKHDNSFTTTIEVTGDEAATIVDGSESDITSDASASGAITDNGDVTVAVTNTHYVTISYDANTGAGNVDAQKGIPGETATLNDGSSLKKDGYVFLGWSKKQLNNIDTAEDYNTNKDDIIDPSEGWAVPDKDTILHAVWAKDTDGDKDPDYKDPTPDGDTGLTVAKYWEGAEPILQQGEEAPIYGVGDTIMWYITVTNEGQLTLSDVVLADTLDGVKLYKATLSGDKLTKGEEITPEGDTFKIGTVEPGEDGMVILIAEYTVTSGDLLAGVDITNKAKAGGTAPLGTQVTSDEATSTVPADNLEEPTYALEVTKKAVSTPVNDDGKYHKNDTIDYEITIKNNGDAEIAGDITIVEDFVVSLTDGKSYEGYTVSLGTDGKTITVKFADGKSLATNDFITVYVTLTVDDEIIAEAMGQNGKLYNSVEVSADVDGDGDDDIENVPGGDGKDCGCGGDSTSGDCTCDEGECKCGQGGVEVAVPGMTVEKDLSNAGQGSGKDGAFTVGDVIEWTITVTNDGNVALTNISIEDKLAGVTLYEDGQEVDNPYKLDTLAAGGTITLTAKYTVTEQDLKNGSITNTVEVTCDQLKDSTPGDESKVGGGDGDGSLEKPENGFEVEKKATNQPKNGKYFAVGETIKYEITITNTSGSKITDDIIILEKLPVTNPNVTTGGGSAALGTVEAGADHLAKIMISGVDLEPNASITVTVDLEVTADVIAMADNGELVNSVTVGVDRNNDGKPDDDDDAPKGDDDDSDRGGVQVPNPSLKVTKKEISARPYKVGDTIVWTIIVENDGNVDLTNVEVTDELKDVELYDAAGTTKLGGSTYTIASLPAGEKVTLTAKYVLKSADLGKELVNRASASAADPAGDGDQKVESPEGGDSESKIPSSDLRPGSSTGGDSSGGGSSGKGPTVTTPTKPGKPEEPVGTGVEKWLDTVNHNAYMSGYPDGTFGVTGILTRAEAAQILYNLLLEKNVPITVRFTDVPSNAWYSTAVNTLASLGIITGMGDGRYEPNRPITRAEFVTIVIKFADEIPGGVNIFSDVKRSDWFYTFVIGAVEYGWISGYNGLFRPNDTITRSEAASIVNSVLGRSPDFDYVDDVVAQLLEFSDLRESYWAYYVIREATTSHDYSTKNGKETWTNLK